MEKTLSPVYFGEWVKRRRKALDLTQDELSQRSGCSIFALRKIESGERRPSKQLAELLADALDISIEERKTFIRVARGESNLERLKPPALDVAFSITPGPSRIPLQPTPLIGRDSELAAMERIFANPECRLLTLTGMGGIGKTRLAVEFATRQQAMFPAGVYYVSLAPVNTADAIVPAIADAVGFVFSGTIDLQEQIINYIASQLQHPLMLVLDNVEHLLVNEQDTETTSAVELVSELLQRLPNIKILATSRERLSLRGEWTYELHGLAFPTQAYSFPLESYSATALFLQSALRSKADFDPTPAERKAIVNICRLLDGTPLAIELAAAWVGILSCAEILQELTLNIDFLTTSMRDVPERHRSLRATFDHSWKLLAPEERNALCRLSVFHGGFDRAAAGKIARASLPMLASLVSKSLVRRAENGRYDLHEVIRQFAHAHLEENPHEFQMACEMHSVHYLEQVFGNEMKLKTSAQQETVREMADSLDNIRAAWNWAMEQQKFGYLGLAARSMGWFFEVTGLLREGIELLEPVIQALKARARDPQEDRLLGLAFLHQGLLHFRKGHFAHAQELYRESIVLFRKIEDRALLADALSFLGIIIYLNGDYVQSRELLEESLVHAQASQARRFEAFGIYNLGYLDSLAGLYQEGYQQMLVGMKIWREQGDPQTIALGLNYMVPTLCKLGLFDEAIAAMRESLKICEETKHRWGMGTAYRFFGQVYLAAGDYAQAQIQLLKSLETFGEFFEGWDIALALSLLGEAYRMAGDLSQARQVYHNALQTAVEAGAKSIAVNCLLGLAHLFACASQPERALELALFTEAHPSSTQEVKDRASRLSFEIALNLPAVEVHSIRMRAEDISLESLATQLILA